MIRRIYYTCGTALSMMLALCACIDPLGISEYQVQNSSEYMVKISFKAWDRKDRSEVIPPGQTVTVFTHKSVPMAPSPENSFISYSLFCSKDGVSFHEIPAGKIAWKGSLEKCEKLHGGVKCHYTIAISGIDCQ